MDQNYVQRYHAARSAKEASRSIWLCVYWYLPVSLLFFVIGSALYAYFNQHPELLIHVKEQVAMEKGVDINSLVPADYGDKILPYFMVLKVPKGLVGLIIAAILSAAMSSISSGMNSSATVFLKDIYQRYINPNPGPKKEMRILYTVTALSGILSIVFGIAIIGVKSVLDLWWEFAGIFSGGMLGLFLLGLIVKKAGNVEAVTGTVIGIIVILWMSLSKNFPQGMEHLKSPFHVNMIIVVGTLTIFLVGLLVTKLKKR